MPDALRLFYLRKANLRDKAFIHDFAFHFDKQKQAIILHDLFGENAADTRFVSKRLSAVLSEAMIVNFAASGDQKNLLTGSAEQPKLRAEILRKSFETVPVFIMNPLLSGEDPIAIGFTGASTLAIIQQLRNEFQVEEVVLFPDHSLSPLGKTPVRIHPIAIGSHADIQDLLNAYDEEKEVLELAAKLAPSIITSPGK